MAAVPNRGLVFAASALFVTPMRLTRLVLFLLLFGFVEGFAQPSTQAQLVIELNTKGFVEEVAEEIAADLRVRQPGGGRTITTEPEGVIRIEPSPLYKLDPDLWRQQLSQIYPSEQGSFEVTPAPDATMVRLSSAALAVRMNRAIEATIPKIKTRLAGLGIDAPIIRREGDRRISIATPGFTDVGKLKAAIADRGKLSFQRVRQALTPEEARSYKAPAGSAILPAREGGFVVIDDDKVITEKDVAEAHIEDSPYSAKPAVLLRMTIAATQKFHKFTTENIGRKLAVVFDGEVLSAPVIREPIHTGATQITVLPHDDAPMIARQLDSGRLLAAFTVVEGRVIGNKGK
jgi:SecD/SecF fusion protein